LTETHQKVDVVKANDEVVPGSITDRKLKVKEQLASRISWLFAIALIVTLLLVAGFAIADYYLLAHDMITSEARLVTPEVIQTLIVGTVIEVGAAFAALVTGVFLKRSNDDA
jgi:multisubunit Na+/H+ antiporter MnhB subunit